MKRGVWYGIAAYTIWGLIPLYWRLLRDVPAIQLISHRILWSFLLLAVVLAWQRAWPGMRVAAGRPGVLRTYAIAAALISVNWLTYVWAVNAGHIVETSLGYFINPLISIVFGVLLLGERLRPWQWAAVLIAAAGVVYLTFDYGRLPWIALTLATTFALYGLVKKTAPLGSVPGLALETGLLLIPAFTVLTVFEMRGVGAFGHRGAITDVLIAFAGIGTTVPLLMFASACRRIPLTWVGVLQYISPTLSMLLGVFVYGEAVSSSRLFGFMLVWAALVVFGVEGIAAHKATPFPPATE